MKTKEAPSLRRMRGGGAFVLERKEVVWQIRCWDMSDYAGSFAGLPAACRLTAEKWLCGVIAGRSCSGYSK